MHISTPKPSKIMIALMRHENLASFCHGTRTRSVLDSIVADPRIQITVSQYSRWIKNVFFY